MNKTKKQNILVVDDEPHIVNLVKLSLNKEAFNVKGVYSAREALENIKTNSPDLLIVDIMMPGVNGYELCKEIRTNTITQNIPIIILSAKTQLNDKLQAIDVGADDYLTKPFDPIELERRVYTNLNNKIENLKQVV
ncbi:MAG: response regulator transcription factor [Nanoarchaeota archaeon]